MTPNFSVSWEAAQLVAEVFDFPCMTDPLQEEIFANVANCSWHGVCLPEHCLEICLDLTRAVDRQCQNREKIEEAPTQRRTLTNLHTCVENSSTYQEIYTDTLVMRHTTILAFCLCFVHEDVAPYWQLSGLFGFSVWTLNQTSLLTAAVWFCGGAWCCPRGLIWVSRHGTNPKWRWQIQAPSRDPAAFSKTPTDPHRGVSRSSKITKDLSHLSSQYRRQCNANKSHWHQTDIWG